ncbi:MAG: electron transport complex subunit RsxG [Gammaproteobacteria bacterium]|nr:electron transport complex subunit RsxG [Gammaproteobacteria bacterium]
MGTVTEPSYRKRVGYQAMLLGSFSALATVMLVSGDLATHQEIADRKREDLLLNLSEVLPAAYYDNDLLQQPLQIPNAGGASQLVYRGTQAGAVSALAYERSGSGYSGEIRILLGLTADGTILGVRVLSHSETPGLGDKIEVARDAWITRFNGLSLGNPPPEQWKVKKDGGRFDAFSGATITPRAVVLAIKEGLLFYQQQRDQLLAVTPVAVTQSGE